MKAAQAKDRLTEAVDFVLLQGLLKITPRGTLAHAPFALLPSPIDPALCARMVELTPLFNRLAYRVSRDTAFLEDALAPAARSDAFTARLLAMAKEGGNAQHLHLAFDRSDYFIHRPHPGAPSELRQVELNTISVSYAGLAALVNRLHSHLLSPHPPPVQPPMDAAAPEEEPALVPNDPVPVLAEAFGQALSRYGHSGAVVVMVVQPGETNRFDQRMVEFALARRGVATLRMTLEDIAHEGRLREGHLVVGGTVAAITYLRAGYGPEDFRSEDAFRGRTLIEASSTIAVPGLYAQLAGTKKVQQLLTGPSLLRKYLSHPEACLVEDVFAGQYALEDAAPENAVPEGGDGAGGTVLELALTHPERFVLKPQREGGGHNYFDEELRAKAASLNAAERSAYILMERILPPRHPALLVREGALEETEAVSEIGRFGAFLAEDGEEWINRDAGYLVRTKAHGTLEGGVSAGFGFLDSLFLERPNPPR